MVTESLETLLRLGKSGEHCLEGIVPDELYGPSIRCSCGEWSRRLEVLMIPLGGKLSLEAAAFWLGARIGLAWAEHVHEAERRQSDRPRERE